jgi:asparagine synthase (glutamine-hydrolysing)
MIERAAAPYRALVPSPLRLALGALLRDRAGRRSEGLRRRVALVAGAGARSAADAFVYDRAFRRLRARAYTSSLLGALGEWHPDALYREAWARAVAADDVDRALYGDITTYLPDQLLAKADASSMAHGLETRAPFLGREMLEFAATLPTSLRLKGWTTKYLLKRVAERYVPHEALHRRKQGFVMPASDWLRADLAPFARATLDTRRFHDRGWIRPESVRRLLAEHTSRRRDWGQQLWTLLVLEIWARLALDRDLAPGDPLDVGMLAGSAR